MIRKLIGALVLVEVGRLSARVVYRTGVATGVFSNDLNASRDLFAALGEELTKDEVPA
jgi:hypothetical protein